MRTYWNYWLLLGTVRIVLTRCVPGTGASEGAHEKKNRAVCMQRAQEVCRFALSLPPLLSVPPPSVPPFRLPLAREACSLPPCPRYSLQRSRFGTCTTRSTSGSAPCSAGADCCAPYVCAPSSRESAAATHQKKSAKDRVNQCVWAQAPNRNHHARTRIRHTAKAQTANAHTT